MRLLFTCPHAAAKTVLAAAIARDLATRRGLPLTSTSAGTQPDDHINPLVTSALEMRGLHYPDQPRSVTAKDITSADIVISLGVPLTDLPAKPQRLVDWSDVPDASTDIDALYAILTHRVRGLVDVLATTE